MIEGEEVTKNNKIIGQSKDDFVYLLNGAKYIFLQQNYKKLCRL